METDRQTDRQKRRDRRRQTDSDRQTQTDTDRQTQTDTLTSQTSVQKVTLGTAGPALKRFRRLFQGNNSRNTCLNTERQTGRKAGRVAGRLARALPTKPRIIKGIKHGLKR